MRNAYAIYYAVRATVATLLFPGVVVHEAAHVLFCKFFGIRVHEVRFFSIKRAIGYVHRDNGTRPIQNILIGLGPMLVNPLVGFGLGALLVEPGWRHLLQGPGYLVYCWLGVSISAMGAPSFGDVQQARQLVMYSPSAVVRGMSFGLIGIALTCAIGGLFLLDVACGAFVFFAPSLIWK